MVKTVRTACARCVSVEYRSCKISGKKNSLNTNISSTTLMIIKAQSLRPTVIERNPCT